MTELEQLWQFVDTMADGNKLMLAQPQEHAIATRDAARKLRSKEKAKVCPILNICFTPGKITIEDQEKLITRIEAVSDVLYGAIKNLAIGVLSMRMGDIDQAAHCIGCWAFEDSGKDAVNVHETIDKILTDWNALPRVEEEE